MAAKGTWTTGSPPNHLPTILGALALVVMIGVGLANHADRVTRPTPTPSASAAPTRTPATPAPRPPATPVGLRHS